jgi:hypothetical protein
VLARRPEKGTFEVVKHIALKLDEILNPMLGTDFLEV